MAILRKITLGILSKDTLKKGGISSKRLAAAVNPIYREELIEKYL